MKVLVTGGAGFIGVNFLDYMIKKYPQYQFYNLDALTYAGHLCTCKHLEQYNHYTFIKGDIRNREFLFNLFNQHKFDLVVHFAAESHVDHSIKNPSIFVESNVLGTLNLLDVSRAFNIKRFHQVSTDEVYGYLPLDRPDLLFTEKTSINPTSPYSASKASADLLVQSYYKTFKMPVTISRCSNNYGPYQLPEKLIPLMIFKALQEQKLPVYGDGRHVRDWLHVFDHCRAIDLIIHNGREGEVYNIGGGSELSNIELVKRLLRLLNQPESLIEFVSDRLGHDLRYAIDCTKLESELGYKPIYTFEHGLKETIEWYLKNKMWMNEVMK